MNVLEYLKSMNKWPEKDNYESRESNSYNQALTDLETILSGIDWPEGLDEKEIVKIFDAFDNYNGDVKQGKIKIAKAICTRFAKPSSLEPIDIEESDLLAKQITVYLKEGNNIGLADFLIRAGWRRGLNIEEPIVFFGKNRKWHYCYNDENNRNQHSKPFDTEKEAYDAYHSKFSSPKSEINRELVDMLKQCSSMCVELGEQAKNINQKAMFLAQLSRIEQALSRASKEEGK
jgi:hypothetical protein